MKFAIFCTKLYRRKYLREGKSARDKPRAKDFKIYFPKEDSKYKEIYSFTYHQPNYFAFH